MSRRSYLQRIAAPRVNKGEGAVLVPPKLLFRPTAMPPDSATGAGAGALGGGQEAAGARDRCGAARSSIPDLRAQDINSGLAGPVPASTRPPTRVKEAVPWVELVPPAW